MTERTVKTRSAIVRIEGDEVVKRFHRRNRRLYRNEVQWLRAFDFADYVPQLVDHSDAKLTIRMRYVGEPITAASAPSDWKQQMTEILKGLAAVGCRHGDLLPSNILVKGGKLSIIDFAAATRTSDSQPQKKKRVFSDAHAISRLHYHVVGFPENSEVHAFTIWDAATAEFVEREITKKLTVIDRITFSPLLYTDYCSDRATWLKKFYNTPELRGSPKAKIPFSTIVVLSRAPAYDRRRQIFSSEMRIVNTEIFDLKNKVRAGREGFIHASDNLEEARRNLRWLSYDETSLPFRYFTMNRPQFGSMVEVFDCLNRLAGVRYVLLRRPSDERGPPREDYDLLCDDFFRVKRALGGMAYKSWSDRLFQNVGPAVDDGGFKVAQNVCVAGGKVSFDIRYVGDGYFPRQWQMRMLRNRIFSQGVYVCAPDDDFFAKAYHALFHKPALSQKYQILFSRELSVTDGRKIRSVLTDLTLGFLRRNGFSITRPKDFTLAYNPPSLTRYAMRRELYLVKREMRNRNYSGASKILLNSFRIQPRPGRFMYWMGHLLIRWAITLARDSAEVFRRRVVRVMRTRRTGQPRNWLAVRGAAATSVGQGGRH